MFVPGLHYDTELQEDLEGEEARRQLGATRCGPLALSFKTYAIFSPHWLSISHHGYLIKRCHTY